MSDTRGRAVILPGTDALPSGGRGDSSSPMDFLGMEALHARRQRGEGCSNLDENTVP